MRVEILRESKKFQPYDIVLHIEDVSDDATVREHVLASVARSNSYTGRMMEQALAIDK